MHKFLIVSLFLFFFSTLFLLSCKNDDNCVETSWYIDNDVDGFGNLAISVESCLQPEGYVSNSLDCNDSDATINPNAEEICDGNDNDCDGFVDGDDSDFDPNAIGTWYRDLDGDGYGDSNPAFIITSCEQPEGYVSNALDCNDHYLEIALAKTFYKDADNDGFGDPNDSTVTCLQPNLYVTNNLDCNDSNVNIFPGASEIPNDEIDNNCNGVVDEGCVPDCTGKSCGDDGCGGSCGSCTGTSYCNSEGNCE